MNNHMKIINIISGKGGTGKTLFTAVVAEMLGNEGASVLVVDLDVFVRGLTALLYFHKNESLKITENEDIPVSAFFKTKGILNNKNYNKNISISRYRSFDVFPSVTAVNELLDFRDIMPDNVEEATCILNDLLDSIPNKYDFIFFDSRAGYDELISASHSISDLSICVEEDDDISMVTTDNLIEQLRRDSKSKNLFRVKNKVRTEKRPFEGASNGITFLGNIPFDTDVLNSFGTKSFWGDISKSIYREAVIGVWNTLSKKMSLGFTMKETRISPLGNKKVEKKLSMLSSLNRVFFVYGVIISIVSSLLVFGGNKFLNELLGVFDDPIRLVALITSLFGISMTVFSVFRNRK